MPKTQPTLAKGHIDCDGQSSMSRRSFFKGAAMGFMGLSLLDLMKVSVLADGGGKAESVILVWLGGGPSHIDTFDPKPGTPTGGLTKGIDTSADGIQIAEYLPLMAKQMDKCALIRSLTNKEGSHERASYEMHTGYKQLSSITHPALGSLVAKEMGRKNEELPAFISIGYNSYGAGFLGASVAPFFIGDPNNPSANLTRDREMDATRFQGRMDLLRTVDSFFGAEKRSPVMDDYALQFREAVKMMQSKSVEAFDWRKEPAEKINKYGNNYFGHAALIARRLVEKGVRFVEISLGGWDNHENVFQSVGNNCKSLDAGLANLIDELNASGKLKSTMIICTGEFGRTPKINEKGGRDHYPRVWSALLAGGGLKQGYVHGASDAAGEDVKEKPTQPGEIHATMYKLLGVDFMKENQTDQGRPIRLVEKAKPITDLIA